MMITNCKSLFAFFSFNTSSHHSHEAQALDWLTGVEQEEEFQTGNLSAINLQRPQPHRQLLTSLD